MPPTAFVLRASAFIIPFSSSNVHPMRFLSSPSQNVFLKKDFYSPSFEHARRPSVSLSTLFPKTPHRNPLLRKSARFQFPALPFSAAKASLLLLFAAFCRRAPLGAFTRRFFQKDSPSFRRNAVPAFTSPFPLMRRKSVASRNVAAALPLPKKKKERLQSVPFHVLYISRDNEFSLL